jgi:gamma-D-glutamyl-L-lysine dipeptidyl-peptidase
LDLVFLHVKIFKKNMFAICTMYCAPLMSAKGHKNEMVTQILFGEAIQILDSDGLWCYAKALWDGYEGWALVQQFEKVDALPGLQHKVGINVANILIANKQLTIPACSTLPNYASVVFKINNQKAEIDLHLVHDNNLKYNEQNILEILNNYLHVPYVWGGRTHAGIDCSGLSAILFKYYNMPLRHDASWQVTQGEEVHFLQSAQIGDLAFFGTPDGDINHVGILLNNHLILHATETSGGVCIDNIDTEGIIKKDSGKRTHQLRIIKRLKALEF